MLSKWVQPFTPLRLFAAGEQGGWWDPSDFGTMFQDSAGTTPVTAVGQPVGLIRDKSGRGNHRTQSTTTSRPLLQQDAGGFFYLSYDGVDDSMATATVDFSATDKLTVWCGARKLSDANRGMLIRCAGLNAGWQMEAPPTAAAAQFSFRSVGTLTAQSSSAANYAAPFSAVLTGIGDISGDIAKIRVNQNETASAADQGTGNYSALPISFGAQSDGLLPFNGREYQTIIRGAASSAAQIVLAERFVGAKMGIAL